MTRVYSVLRLAAPAALALAVGATPALALSTFGELKCDDPTATDQDLDLAVGASSIGFTSNHDDKDCRKLCSDLKKICDSNVKNRVKCIKDDDKTFFGILKEQCKIENLNDKEAREACEDDVEADEDECKGELEELEDVAQEECEAAFGKDGSCETDCLDQVFPFHD